MKRLTIALTLIAFFASSCANPYTCAGNEFEILREAEVTHIEIYSKSVSPASSEHNQTETPSISGPDYRWNITDKDKIYELIHIATFSDFKWRNPLVTAPGGDITISFYSNDQLIKAIHLGETYMVGFPCGKQAIKDISADEWLQILNLLSASPIATEGPKP